MTGTCQPRTQFQVHTDTSEENLGKWQKNVSREPDFMYTAILVKKMNENVRECTKTHTKHPHIPQKSKIPENPGVPWSRVIFCKQAIVFKSNLLSFVVLQFLHLNHVFFNCFAFFACSHKDYLQKCSLFSKTLVLAIFYKVFGPQHAQNAGFRCICLPKLQQNSMQHLLAVKALCL